MDQDYMEEIVKKANVPYQMGRRQKQYKQVRFLGVGSDHSLNLGYSEPKGEFIADFVFKGATKNINIARRDQFNIKHGGESGKGPTIYSKNKIPFSDERRLIQIIQDYWQIDVASEQIDAPIKTTIRRNPKAGLPKKEDVEFAASQIPQDSGGDIEAILDQVEKNAIADGKQLKPNWRMKTEENIKIWFK